MATIISMAVSCEPREIIQPDFEDAESKSIYHYVNENDYMFSYFLSILDTTKVGKTISAYNPYGAGYTLFLPTNEAVEEYINSSSTYSSLDQLLGDKEFVSVLARYHIVNLGIDANDFPYGALPAYTLTEDLLTVNIVLGEDSSYYNINNQAPVISTNHELSNGFVHVIGKMLKPINYSTYDWIKENSSYSIFTEAVELTGFNSLLNQNLKEDSTATPITLLIEPDTVYNKKGIFILQDLLDTLGVTSTNYTDEENPLYQYVGYHILAANAFLDAFLDESTNFTTYSNYPLRIDGRGIDIIINEGKQNFDTIIRGSDTTVIDYIGFNYDASNVISQSGAIHIIDQIMRPQTPSRATVTFQFFEEPIFNEYRKEAGEYTVDKPEALKVITFSGAELVFVLSADEEHQAWSRDYLLLEGDFTISYQLPKIVQGKYSMHIRAHSYSEDNALIEVFLDGKKIGRLVDLSTGGSESFPYANIKIGNVDFSNYESHTVEVRSLIPGRFEWDYVRFEPVTN